jgi:hypothetical protein
MDILQSRTVILSHSSRVEIHFTFLGNGWKEERLRRGRLEQDYGRLSLADVLAAIGNHQMQREAALRIDPKGAAALTAEDQLLKA